MTDHQLLALAGFSIASSFTPGPNNLMLMASGANFGLRRSLPHMMGVTLGFAAMVVLMGLGLAGLILAVPQLMVVLKIVSVVYMLWLAWKVAHAAAPQAGGPGGKGAGHPTTFLQAAGFQWVNPKAWAMALTANAVYAPQGLLWDVGIVGLVLGLVSLPSVAVWAWAGQVVQRWLANPRALALFNWTMAVLLVASLWPILKT